MMKKMIMKKKMKKVLTAAACSAAVLSLSAIAPSGQAQTPSGETAHGEIVLGGHGRYCLTLERGKEDAKQLPADVLPCTGTMSRPGERQGWTIARFVGLAFIHPRAGWCLGADLPSQDAIAYDCSGDSGSRPAVVLEIHQDNGLWSITDPDGKALSVNTGVLVKYHNAPAYWGEGDLWYLPDNWKDA